MRFRKAFVARAASILLLTAALTSGGALRGEAGAQLVDLRAGARASVLPRAAASLPQSRVYERIAFASGREIFLINPDGSGLTQLTHSDSGVYNYQPALSPDGMRVAFGSTRDNKSGIFILEVDGTGLRRLTTNNASFDSEPAWSPDGSKIAFVRGFDTTSEGVANHTECGSEIYIVSVNDEAAEFNLTGSNLSGERGGTDPSWSPDGTRIAFASNRGGSYDIYSITIEGREVEQLTRTQTQEEAEPAWSPDGKRIAYAGNYVHALLYCGFAHTGLGPQPAVNGPDIYVMSSDGSEQTRLTFTEDNIEPAWSPDGASLAFVSWRGGNTQTQIYIMGLSGGGEFSITSDSSYKLSPSWSRAGRGLLTGGK